MSFSVWFDKVATPGWIDTVDHVQQLPSKKLFKTFNEDIFFFSVFLLEKKKNVASSFSSQLQALS